MENLNTLKAFQSVSTILPADLNAAGKVGTAVCYNILAGKLHSDITKAALNCTPRDSGPLYTLLPDVRPNDIVALKYLATIDAATIRKAWNEKQKDAKRETAPTLQALRAAVMGKSTKEKTKTFKERFIEEYNAATNLEDLSSRMHKLFVDVSGE